MGDLLSDLRYNKELAEKKKEWGYHTLGYKNAKDAKYLFDLPEKLQSEIYDAQNITSAIYNRGGSVEESELEELNKLLNKIIPKLENHLDD